MKRGMVILVMVAELGLVAMFAMSQGGGGGAPEVKVPQLLNYQGFLTDAGGKPLEGTYQITFTLYDHPTLKEAGRIKWTETRSVAVSQGHFAILLGQVQPIPPDLFKTYPNLYVATRIGSNPEMTPRQQIASVGYAAEAQHAELAKKFEEPKGMIAMFKTECPQGWSRVPELDQKFVRGGTPTDFPNDAGGYETHFHTFHGQWTAPAHNLGNVAHELCRTGCDTRDGHNHSLDSVVSDSESSLPPYVTVYFCEKQ